MAKAKKQKKSVTIRTLVKREGKPAGEVTHFFSDIKVAVIKLKIPLIVGDEIRIMGGEDTDFNQKISSMQIDHEKITKAKKGAEIGVKLKEKAREGYKVYKVSA